MRALQKSVFTRKDPARNEGKPDRETAPLNPTDLICVPVADGVLFAVIYTFKSSGLPLHSGEQVPFSRGTPLYENCIEFPQGCILMISG